MKRWLAAAACSVAGVAGAADAPLWEAGVGVSALTLPHYRGSDENSRWLLPVPYVVYRGEIFKADRDGARAVVLESDRFEVDLSVFASAPAKSEDSDARRGMPDLAATFELGPNVSWTLGRGARWRLDLRSPIRAALTLQSDPRWIGWSATPHINLDVLAPRDWRIGLLAGPVFGSRRLHGYYYDVAPAEALPERPSYSAAGGFGGAAALAAVSRRWADRWFGTFVRADTVRGAQFADSPLVRQRANVSFGIALAWVFATSSRRVPVDE